MRSLINILKGDPTIEEVHFTPDGQWSLNHDRRHSVTKSREEVLALEATLPVEDIKPDELESMVEENRLLKEKIEMLEMEKTILEEDKAGFQEKVKLLEAKLETVSSKNSKFKNAAS